MSEQDEEYREPELAINRVYTRKGDSGQTRLVGGQKVPKNQPRIESYGTIDELNSVIGLARQTMIDSYPDNEEIKGLAASLLRVQHELFNLGSILATLPEDVGDYMPRVQQADIDALEADMDRCNEHLATLRSFILPGGSQSNALLHVCRTVCRRAERLMVAASQTEEIDELAIAYVNRLSDALFVWSRWVSHATETEEVLWQPNKAASAQES